MEKEITNGQYNAVMGITTHNSDENYLPVKFINWYQAVIFCNKLSMLEGLDAVYSICGSSL
ncbi:MAG: hypothetical protein LBQ55_05190 [Treponema sp.]|nr:hypothetical protein [Treponema sp.]